MMVIKKMVMRNLCSVPSPPALGPAWEGAYARILKVAVYSQLLVTSMTAADRVEERGVGKVTSHCTQYSHSSFLYKNFFGHLPSQFLLSFSSISQFVVKYPWLFSFTYKVPCYGNVVFCIPYSISQPCLFLPPHLTLVPLTNKLYGSCLDSSVPFSC